MPPTFRPHRIRLVGHRDLGTLPARWLGCLLELEDGTRYGPCAVFSAEPKRSRLVWHPQNGAWCLCLPDRIAYLEAAYIGGSAGARAYAGLDSNSTRATNCPDIPAAIAQITAWAREDGYDVPAWPGEAKVEAVPEPAPKDRTVYDPKDVQRGDVHHLADGTSGTVLGALHGWTIYTDHVPVRVLDVVRVEPVDDDIPF